MPEDLIQRGILNVEDATYLRKKIIPVALADERWNLVVRLAYDLTELLVKGVICLCGDGPRQTHDIDKLVDQLLGKIAEAAKGKIDLPLIVSAKSDDGVLGFAGYGVLIEAGGCSLVEVNGSGSYAEIASVTTTLSVDQIVKLRIEVENFAISVYVGDTLILSTMDATHSGPYAFCRSFQVFPTRDRVRALKDAGDELRKNRESSFYSERRFDKNDATRAIQFGDIAFEAASCFFAVQWDEESAQN
jgi:hypothetical protein